MAEETVARRTTRGPGFQDDVTESIMAAFFEELGTVGYGKLSIDAVAKRAGSGKAAIYRRWPGKQAMTIALVSDLAALAIDVPDTGSLRGDVRQFLVNACASMEHPLARTIVPDLLAEATRNPEFATAILGAIRDPRREKAETLLTRAVERGELTTDADLDIALELLAGPLYWRLVVLGDDINDEYFDRLTNKIVTALQA
jgi:AcrR family transcriptional regulator